MLALGRGGGEGAAGARPRWSWFSGKLEHPVTDATYASANATITGPPRRDATSKEASTRANAKTLSVYLSVGCPRLPAPLSPPPTHTSPSLLRLDSTLPLPLVCSPRPRLLCPPPTLDHAHIWCPPLSIVPIRACTSNHNVNNANTAPPPQPPPPLITTPTTTILSPPHHNLPGSLLFASPPPRASPLPLRFPFVWLRSRSPRRLLSFSPHSGPPRDNPTSPLLPATRVSAASPALPHAP